jgi:hypothetical protein
MVRVGKPSYPLRYKPGCLTLELGVPGFLVYLGRRKKMSDDKLPVPKSERIEDLMAVELPSAWGSSTKIKKGIEKSLANGRVKHGLYSAIPMVCRGETCAYKETCPLFAVNEHPVGERCPIEISEILLRFESYTRELNIDDYDNIIDMTLIKDLIDLDVQIKRADNRLSIDGGEFIQDVVINITEDGDEITNPAIHKAVEYKERLLKNRHGILQLLNSTRKDKAGSKITVQTDPSTYAAQLMAQVAAMEASKQGIIDVTPIEYEGDDE